MKLKFSVHYSTVWGQSLHVMITYIHVGGRRKSYDLSMQTQDGDLWTLETPVMESRQRPVESFEYFYQVEDADGKPIVAEWHRNERRYHFDADRDYILPDQWRDIPLQYHLLSKAYRTAERIAEMQRDTADAVTRLPLFRKTIIFRVLAPQLRQGESLAICGNHPSLGDWNPSRFIRMHEVGESEWILSLNVDNISFPLEYKYVVIDDSSHQLVRWEEGENRSTGEYKVSDGQVLVLYGENLRVRETMWRIAGLVVPLFAVKTEASFGTGDFGDLKPLADWAADAGMKMIQLLPVFDTTTTHTWSDSNPYNCISLHALHPHYMDLAQLGTLEDATKRNRYRKRQRELNALGYVDYEAVDRIKLDYIADVFAERGTEELASPEYAAFCADNKDWLYAYACFCALREHYHTARTSDWQDYAVYDADKLEQLYNDDEAFRRAVDLACFTQYHLHRQLCDAAEYARSKDISLEGDLPAGVCRDSVATWCHPELFRLDMTFGCPPEPTEPRGQNWGIPTYDWTRSKQHDVTSILRNVLKGMEPYFDALRIDHVVSLFRVWEIPVGQRWACLGHFSPSLPLSEEEIRSYGIDFKRELFTTPFITDDIIRDFFGIHADFVRDNYLERKPYGLYALKKDFDTQGKIQRRFDNMRDENSLWICEGLQHLCANVLFVEDPYQHGMYHPRYGVASNPVYNVLSASEKEAFMGLYDNYFFERHQYYWQTTAERRLDGLLADTHLLVCAEDLGMLPKCVGSVLDRSRVLTLEVQQMPKRHGEEFAHLENNPYRSVATPTTHDMAPMRLWWEGNRGRTQRYWITMLQKEGRAPLHLPPHIAEEIVSRHLYCPSMLCMVSIQDLLAMDSNLCSPNVHDERGNAPYDSFNQWKYRMNVTVEELKKSTQFTAKLKTMITRSKR